MKIAVIVEGETEEKALKEAIIRFLRTRTDITMPSLSMHQQKGRIPKGDALKRLVENFCRSYDAVIALTDVYTGTADFADAQDAKEKMKQWVGVNDKFHPHVALHDFEAWLIPYWGTIQRISGSNVKAPARPPEQINHGKPPAHFLGEVFMKGGGRTAYSKPRDASKILKDQDLLVSANACPELKSLLNTILTLSGGTVLP